MRSINWCNYRYFWYDGYGRYGLAFLRALAQSGQINVYPMIIEQINQMPGWLQRMAGLDFSRLTISCMPPNSAVPVPGRQWVSTMYECDALPEGWADYCNWKADMVIVPCEHNARVFYEKGVRKPIYVVNGGTCPTEFPILPERKTDRPYTFLALGDRGSRKGMDIVWSAFWKAFENSDDVRLIIKARPDSIKDIDLTNSDKRVSIWRDDVQSMADVYSQIDCFVFPSRGEGWGMPPREAAMMGLPVIATRYSGLEVGIDNWAIPIDKYTMRPAMLPVKGDWAHPDVEEVKEKMLWCYDHQSEAKALGLRAAQWLRDNQTWDHAAKQLLDLLDRYA